MAHMKRKLFLTAVLGVAFIVSYYVFFEFFYYRDNGAWLSPLPGEPTLRIRRDRWGRGDFGAKRNGRRRHQGVDLLAEEGSAVVASRSGRVRVGNVPKGMGKFIVVTHRDRTKAIYGHLSEIYVKDRSRVRQGEVIGAVGKTGNASFEGVLPHLHFEVRREEEAVNPLPLLVDKILESG